MPSARTVALAVTSAPGSKLPSGSPSLPRPLSPERTPRTTPVLDQQLVARGLGEDVRARLLGLLGQPARQLGDRDDVVAVVLERRRRRDAQRALRGRASSRRPPCRPRRVGSASPRRSTSGNSSCSADGPHDRARQVVRPARLALLDDRDRAPRRAAPSARASSASSWSSRLAQARPAGPPPTIATPTSMRSSSASSSRLMNSCARVDGRRERRRDDTRPFDR